MALTHLLDTSVVKRLARPTVRERVESLSSVGAIGRSNVVDLDVGYSARNVTEWDLLTDALDAFAAIDTTAAHVRRALQVQRLLAARSQRGRKIPDLLIAAAAEERGLTVLHYDADYELIASATGQLVEWVVPAGSVE